MSDEETWRALAPDWLDIHHLAKLPERRQMILDLVQHSERG